MRQFVVVFGASASNPRGGQARRAFAAYEDASPIRRYRQNELWYENSEGCKRPFHVGPDDREPRQQAVRDLAFQRRAHPIDLLRSPVDWQKLTKPGPIYNGFIPIRRRGDQTPRWQ